MQAMDKLVHVTMQMCFISISLPICVNNSLIPLNNSNEIRVGFISSEYDHGAVSLAFEQAQRDGLLEGYNISYVYMNDYCDALYASFPVLELIHQDQVDVVIGPTCTETCQVVAQVASYFNTPTFSSYCMDQNTGNKTVLKTFIRLTGSYFSYDEGFAALFRYYGWTRGVWIISDGSDWCYNGWDITTYMLYNGVPYQEYLVFPKNATHADLVSIALDLQTRGRIITLCHETPSVVVELLFVLQDLGMTNGEYAYFTYEEKYNAADILLDQLNNYSNINITYRRESFLSLKQLSFRQEAPVSEMNDFFKQVDQRNKLPPWDNVVPDNASAGYASLYVYDMTYMYSLLVDSLSSRGLDYRNGTLMFENAYGVNFSGRTGQVEINLNRDRIQTMTLFGYDPQTLSYVPYVDIEVDSSQVREVRDIMEWGGGRKKPPSDTPGCGLRSELCQTSERNHCHFDYNTETSRNLGFQHTNATNTFTFGNHIGAGQFESYLSQ